MTDDIESFFEIFESCLKQNEFRKYPTALGGKSREGLYYAMKGFFDDHRSQNEKERICKSL